MNVVKLEPGILRICLVAGEHPFTTDKWISEQIWKLENVDEISAQGASGDVVVLRFDTVGELRKKLSTRVAEINAILAEHATRPLCPAPVSIWTCDESIDPGKKWCADHEWLEEE